jgi:uncharacterized membrane protein
MNLSLIVALVMLLTWVALVFFVGAPTGWVHLLYAAAVLLFARRILLGRPQKFVS